jgi:trimethylamine--corrinoid protein Co-methyltransferase
MPLASSQTASPSTPIIPKFKLLNREDCLHLHQAACQILKDTGVQVFSQAGRDLLQAAGAVMIGDLIKISPSLVEWALASAPRFFNLYRRGSDQVALQLDGNRVYFGPGSDTLRYLDPRSGQRRGFKLTDIADCIRLCDALPEIGFVMSVGVPVDAPSERTYLYQFATMVRNTTKPVVFVCDDLADIQAIGEMAAAVAGGMDKLTQYPNILLYSEPTTPLQHSLEATEKLLYCAEYAIPITHSPAPMMGGTAPVTIPGAVALGMAEMLSGLVMHQLKNPGAPFLFGHGVHHLDMRSMVSVYGAPEFQLARVMAAEMGRFYGLPVWGYAGHSDSKVIDGQAAVDMQFSVQVAFLARTNLNHDVGYLESGLTNSPEMMVLANEVIAMNRRFVEGIRLDADSLAVDVIAEVGPGGEFMSHDHTMNHFREFWSPKIFDRTQLDRWEEAGSKDLNARLREVTLSYMDEHQVEPLTQEVEKEIGAVLAQA